MTNKGNVLNTDIYAITAEEFSKERDNIEVVKEMLTAGIKVIQYREKHKSKREKLHQCQQIRQMTWEADCTMIVNDDIDIALLTKADGVHVGQEDLPVEQVRKLVGDNMIIGLSTHSPEQAHAALKSGADYIGVGPVFDTDTKEDVQKAVGLEYVEYVANNLNIPFTAIGGIKSHNIQQAKSKGASCFAMVTEIVGADNIQDKIKEIRNLI